MFPVPIIEKLSLVAPLGLCFHDAATGERVIDGLSVAVYAASPVVRKKKTHAVANRSGVFVLHKIAGLEDFSRGAGDAEFWAENPPQKEFIVEVSDRENRFQPFKFSLQLPVSGIYQWEAQPTASPSQSISSIPLYSAPARRVLGAMAVIRAELRESAEKPASFAVLEARFPGKLIARGIADRDGRIVLMFPALAPSSNPLTSPPNATRVTLAAQEREIELTVKYEPPITETSPPRSATADETENLPDLRLVLAQKAGTLWEDAGKNESLTTAVLQTGRELILRSRASPVLSPAPTAAETAQLSYILVSPA